MVVDDVLGGDSEVQVVGIDDPVQVLLNQETLDSVGRRENSFVLNEFMLYYSGR